MENGTTKSQSLEAKIKTTSLTIYGNDFRSQDTESKICNAVYDKIGTTTKSGGNLNDPIASVVYSTTVTDPREPRVKGRSVFLTMKPWMDSLSGLELDEKKKLGALLTRYIQEGSSSVCEAARFRWGCHCCCYGAITKSHPTS